MNELLRMENITKQFGDVYANKMVNLTIRSGEVHTLLGENGAGKSTLMNILMGLYHPTSGSIYVRRSKEVIDSPAKAVALGIGMVHQHFMLVEAMTVFENIILGTKHAKGLWIPKKKMRQSIEALAKRYGLEVDLDQLITRISVGEQQRVEIIKALYRGADILILDEPTAALTDLEVEGLFNMIEVLKKENKSIVFISHKMREVLRISDTITVLRKGEVVDCFESKHADAATLAALMMGKTLVQNDYEKVESAMETVIRLDKVSFQRESKHNGVRDIELSVASGEILGIAGVDGNGQTQIAGLLTGIIKPDQGTIHIEGKEVKQMTPKHFIRHKISHIPEDRNKMGLVGNMSVSDNLMLKSLKNGLFLNKKAMREQAGSWQNRYDIRCESIDQEVRNLSGGNQQKIVLAREIEQHPKVLVAVNPTRGLDVGATTHVHDTLIAARDKGSAIVVISADFDEILRLSDRIVVMYEGEIAGRYSGEHPPVHEISLAMSGGLTS